MNKRKYVKYRDHVSNVGRTRTRVRTRIVGVFYAVTNKIFFFFFFFKREIQNIREN